MIVHHIPGYYSHRTIPARTGSKQAYLMQPLDVRRHHKLYVDDHKWAVGLERMMKKRASALVEHLTLEKEQMRKNFVFKVFGLLSCQLLFVIINLLVFFSVDRFKLLFQENMVLIYILLGIAAVIYLILLFAKPLRNKRVINFCIISSMVFFLSLGTSAYICVYRIYVIVFAIGIQYSIVVFVTVLAKLAPCDVAGCSMICCVVAVVFCIYGVVVSIIVLITGFRLLNFVIAGVIVTVISVYLMFDTQAMLEDKNSEITPNDFVRGNIHLYIDVFLIFFRLFRKICILLKSKVKKRRANKT